MTKSTPEVSLACGNSEIGLWLTVSQPGTRTILYKLIAWCCDVVMSGLRLRQKWPSSAICTLSYVVIKADSRVLGLYFGFTSTLRVCTGYLSASMKPYLLVPQLVLIVCLITLTSSSISNSILVQAWTSSSYRAWVELWYVASAFS